MSTKKEAEKSSTDRALDETVDDGNNHNAHKKNSSVEKSIIHIKDI